MRDSECSQAEMSVQLRHVIQVNGQLRDAERVEALQQQQLEQQAEATRDADDLPTRDDFSADLILREENGFELWLGSMDDALSFEGLSRHGMNAFLNCALEECENECFPFRVGRGRRARCHARGASGCLLDSAATDGATSLIKRIDRHTARSLALFDSEWYGSMLDCDVAYLGFAAQDCDEYDMEPHFVDAISFLDQCRHEGRKVLVHCIMGINRSSAAMVAFMCERLGMSLRSAVSQASKQRGFILTNPSFLNQLVKKHGSEEKPIEVDIIEADDCDENAIDRSEPSKQTRRNSPDNFIAAVSLRHHCKRFLKRLALKKGSNQKAIRKKVSNDMESAVEEDGIQII